MTRQTGTLTDGEAKTYDVLIVGAGFAGLYMLHRLRQIGLSAVVLEAASGIGGTWYNNRYPGLRCDIESLLYSYSFDTELQQEWKWSERYAAQPEILRYIHHVADRFDLRRDIQLDTRVSTATFDAERAQWKLATGDGDMFIGRYCVMATGCLSVSNFPFADQIGAFDGEWHHTSAWPHEPVDFTGKRVGVIGTGSSGIQCIPLIADQAAHLTVFQRTATFAIPANNAPLDPAFEADIKSDYDAWRDKNRRGEIFGGGDLGWHGEGSKSLIISALSLPAEERREFYESHWQRGGAHFAGAFPDLLVDAEANETAAQFVREKIHEIVKDPQTAETLSPQGFPIATKRLCVDTNYFATYNLPNVSLVDLKAEPIECITQTGIRTAAQDYSLDMIVFATGYDAMTGALLAMDIRGCGGIALREKWQSGPKTYLGLAIAGFPNLFTITGPGSPSVFTNMIMSIEQHVDWIAHCLDYMRSQGLQVIEASEEAEENWVKHTAEVVSGTLFDRADSWYLGANIPGKPRVFMAYLGGVNAYSEKCDEVASTGYEGFRLT